MKTFFKSGFIFWTLFFGAALLLVASNGYGGEKKSQAGTYVKIKGGEILVARNITTDRPFWCGISGRLIYVKEGSGIFYYDVKTGKSVNVADVWSSPSACTPDGEWLIYTDKESVRYDKETVERGVVDLWRYEFETGKNQKFVIVDDSYISSANEAIFSPDELSLYLGRRPEERIEMPKPKWDILWSEERGVGTLWLSDGSAIIGAYRELDLPSDFRRDVLEVEVFKPERKVITIYPEFTDFYLLLVDEQNRVYMEKWDEKNGRESIVRCIVDVDKEVLSCETVLDDLPIRAGFDVFRDGETMVFSRTREDNCVRIFGVGEKQAQCITRTGLPMGSYVVISPDERWLAFKRARHIKAKDFDDDLYVIQLETD